MAGRPFTLRRLFGLFALSAKMDLLWLTRDTGICLVQILTDLIGTLSGLSGVFLLSARFGGLGDLSENQVLFMLGYALTVDGLFMVFFTMSNTGFVSRIIGRGQVDHMLIQPVPLWAQFLTAGFIPFTGSANLACGIALSAWSAVRLGLGAEGLAAALVALPPSLAIILASSYIAGSAAFYAPAAAEEISTSIIGFYNSLKQFPLGGLSRFARIALCAVLPAGLVAWFPARTALGIPAGPWWILHVMALGLSATAIILFKKGLCHYAKYGSIRYNAHGFRS